MCLFMASCLAFPVPLCIPRCNYHYNPRNAFVFRAGRQSCRSDPLPELRSAVESRSSRGVLLSVVLVKGAGMSQEFVI